MSFLPAASISLIFALLPAPSMAATTKPGAEAILTKPNLDKIKRFIVKRGEKCTYTNMYNHNPCFSTERYQFFLNPDPGGPHNHPQWNIGCDPKVGDFNTLAIYAKGGGEREIIEFKDAGKITLDGRKISTAKISVFPAQAVKELLAVIEQQEKR